MPGETGEDSLLPKIGDEDSFELNTGDFMRSSRSEQESVDEQFESDSWPEVSDEKSSTIQVVGGGGMERADGESVNEPLAKQGLFVGECGFSKRGASLRNFFARVLELFGVSGITIVHGPGGELNNLCSVGWIVLLTGDVIFNKGRKMG